MSSSLPASERITVNTLRSMKAAGQKIAMLTAYDYTMALLLDKAKIDILLVGDSASNVMAGHETTLPITLQEMIYHACAVVRATRRALVIVDLPFGAYQEGPLQAVRSAVRVMKKTGAHGVKLEGGADIAESIRCIVRAGIPVMGHLGLTPQSIHKFGSYAVQGQEEVSAQTLLADACCLASCGCFAVVLEKIPASLSIKVSKEVAIPTIGIGAGSATDGQVLVSHDMLGLTQSFNPRFLRRYAHLDATIIEATAAYIAAVKNGVFPSPSESY